jgi:hypothetical protein
MAQIQKGTTYSTGDQVTATNLNALADAAILLPGAITDQTAKTVPLAADTVLIHSAADTALRKSTLTQLFANATGIPLTTGVTGILPAANGGTGVNNGANTITIAGNVTHAGAFTQSFTATANTALTLPTTGTLATLAGSEALSNKTITASPISGSTGAFTTLSSTTGANFATSSGSVGIGTASPAYKLSVSASSVTGGIFVQDTDAANASPVIRVQGNRSDNNSSQDFSGGLVLERLNSNGTTGLVSGNVLGTIYFGGNYNATPTFTYPASISAIADGNWSSTSTASTGLAFFTGASGQSLGVPNVTYGTERMRIDNSGNVGIGATTVAGVDSRLRVVGGSDGNTGISMGSSATDRPTLGFRVADNSQRAKIELNDANGASGDRLGLFAFSSGILTEVMSLRGGGNVGIGTTSPSEKLSVLSADNVLSTNIFAVRAQNLTQGVGISFSGIRKLTSGTNSDLNLDGAGSGYIILNANGGSGNVGIGLSNPSYKLQVNGAVAGDGYQSHAGTGAAFGSNQFNFQWTGNPYLWVDTTNVGQIATVSDYRIKKNVTTQTASGLERVMQLRPVSYEFTDYKELFKADGIVREGFIAHEVQEVIPSGAEGTKDEENRVQNLRVDAILSVTVKALQELNANLVAQVAALSQRLAALEKSN